MDTIWIAVAFVLGLIVKAIGLPPLIGYLAAGFILNYYGVQSGDTLRILSDVGINLLLFTIGLKFKIKNLARKEIWGGTSIQVVFTVIVFSLCFIVLSALGLKFFDEINYKTALLIAFALSFSSTVFAVKIFEDFGEINSYHGVLSIGVSIIQDIFAVIFLVIAAQKIPNIYVIGLPFALLILKHLLSRVIKIVGHGELLILFGFFVALVLGSELFNFVGLKADFGALVMGMILSNTKQSEELYEKLFYFKDLFLIGFFISIGLTGFPTINHIFIAFIIALLINFKVIINFIVFTRFKVRARTAFFSTLALANYSEFGLIVAAISYSLGWISADWIIIISLALSISFFVSTPLNTKGHKLFSIARKKLKYFETKVRLEHDKTFDIGDAEILIFGMGRIGTSVYDSLVKKYGKKVLAIDFDLTKVEKHKSQARFVLHDDATDLEFWISVKELHNNAAQVKLVVLCMGNFNANIIAIERLREIRYPGLIAAVAIHEDEIKLLQRLGVDFAYDVYSEAGIGFADNICLEFDGFCEKR